MAGDCHRIQDRLLPYIDGEEDNASRLEIEQHLGICEACQERLEALKILGRMLSGLPRKSLPAGTLEEMPLHTLMAGLPRKKPPEDFDQRILASLRRDRGRPDSITVMGRNWRFVQSLAAAVLVVFLSLAAFQTLEDPPRPNPKMRISFTVEQPLRYQTLKSFYMGQKTSRQGMGAERTVEARSLRAHDEGAREKEGKGKERTP
jgi:hypothetical protein